jgi:hypothetical protein
MIIATLTETDNSLRTFTNIMLFEYVQKSVIGCFDWTTYY